MVQQADGSWQPLRTGDPTATPPPPPREENSAAVAPEQDSTATTPPADPLALAPEPTDTSAGSDGGRER